YTFGISVSPLPLTSPSHIYPLPLHDALPISQIITFGSLQARGVLRDVGRVLEMPYGQVDKLCKLVPQNPAAPVTLSTCPYGISRDRKSTRLHSSHERSSSAVFCLIKKDTLRR